MLTVYPTHPMELEKVAPATLRELQASHATSFTPISSRFAQNDVFLARGRTQLRRRVRGAHSRRVCRVPRVVTRASN